MKEQSKYSFANTMLFWVFELFGAMIGAGVGSMLGSLEVGAFIGLLAGGFSYMLLTKSDSQDSKE